MNFLAAGPRWWRSAAECGGGEESSGERQRDGDRDRKQAYMMATLVQELRNEEQFMADFANRVV